MRVIKRKNAVYLQHSFRKKGKVLTREKFFGTTPKDLEQQKKQFLKECRQEAFYDVFENIKKSFGEEWKRYPESARKKAIEQLAINFTYNTNAIEGSTITLEETRELIEKRISPNKPLDDVKESEKHAALVKTLIEKKQNLTQKTILKWHEILFSETKPDIAGKLRDYLVRVGQYRAPDWQDIPALLTTYFSYIQESDELHTVEQAARLHYRFEKIHPFGDGNGRIGRLIMNHVLWHKGYPLLIIEYKKRQSYYKALGKDEEGFVQYFLRRYMAAHKKYLENKLIAKNVT